MIQLLWILLAMGGLWVSSELVIKNAQIIAQKLKISEGFLGLTVLSIGTSLPEMSTHLISSLAILRGEDLSGIAVGANIGSNIIQITAILGIVGFFLTMKSDRKFLDSDYLVMLGAIILLFVFGYDGTISRLEGGFLFSAYIMYMWRLAQAEHFIEKVETKKDTNLIVNFLIMCVGLGVLLFSANVAVGNAHTLAKSWGVADTLVGALILGLGTALPELAAAIMAIRQKSQEMSVGVLVGSNITNPLVAIGAGAMVSGYTVSETILWLDLPVWFFVSIVALLFFWRDLELQKKEGGLLIVCYVLYVLLKLKFMA